MQFYAKTNSLPVVTHANLNYICQQDMVLDKNLLLTLP